MVGGTIDGAHAHLLKSDEEVVCSTLQQAGEVAMHAQKRVKDYLFGQAPWHSRPMDRLLLIQQYITEWHGAQAEIGDVKCRTPNLLGFSAVQSTPAVKRAALESWPASRVAYGCAPKELVRICDHQSPTRAPV